MGRAVFLTDQIAPHVMTVLQTPTYAVTDFWKALTLPADNSAATAKDPCQVPFVVAPPTGGCVFRVVEFPPDHYWEAKVAAMGGSAPVDETAPVAKGGAGRPGQIIGRSLGLTRSFCKGRSGDFGCRREENVAGDAVQRGANHAWADRSEKPSPSFSLTPRQSTEGTGFGAENHSQ
jgi:hypothetical protein